MFLLRSVRNLHRWKPPKEPDCLDQVVDAAGDLTPRFDEDLSVYMVSSREEASYLAHLYGITNRPLPNHFRCIVFSAGGVDNFSVVSRPALSSHPFLARRHCEILGLRDVGRRQTLVRSIFCDPNLLCMEIRKIDLVKTARCQRYDPHVGDRMTEKWREAIR